MVDFLNIDNEMKDTFVPGKGDKEEFPSFDLAQETALDKALLAKEPVNVVSQQAVAREVAAPKPQEPVVQFDSSLPENVLESMQTAQAVAKNTREAQRNRSSDMIALIEKETNTINDAERKIENSQDNPFGELIGLFNNDYDVSEQQRIIRESTRTVKTQSSINQLKNQSEQLAISDASADFNQYEAQQKMRGREIRFSTAELNMQRMSNAARQFAADYTFDQATTGEIAAIAKSGNYDSVFTQQRVQEFNRKQQAAKFDARSAVIAYEAGEIEHGRMLKNRTLESIPLPQLNEMLEMAQEIGGSVEIGEGLKVAPSELVAEINKKNAVWDTMRTKMAEDAVKIAKNDADFNEFTESLGLYSDEFFGTQARDAYRGVNLLNVNDKLIAGLDLHSMHPKLRSDAMTILRTVSNMNEVGADKQKQLVLEKQLKAYKVKMEEVKKAEIDSQPTKELKAAKLDYLTHGRMSAGVNAAEVTAANVSVMPDFKGDRALETAWNGFAQNVIEDVSGEKLELVDKAGKLSTQALIQAAFAENLRGKPTSTELVLKNINLADDKGRSLQDKYATTKAHDVMIQAVQQLATKVPGIRAQLFDSNNQPLPSWANNHQELAKILARISHGKQRTDSSLKNNFMNYALNDEINAIFANNSQAWNAQTSMEQGSFVANLFKGRSPANLVETSIGYSWVRHFNPAWIIATQEAQGK